MRSNIPLPLHHRIHTITAPAVGRKVPRPSLPLIRLRSSSSSSFCPSYSTSTSSSQLPFPSYPSNSSSSLLQFNKLQSSVPRLHHHQRLCRLSPPSFTSKRYCSYRRMCSSRRAEDAPSGSTNVPQDREVLPTNVKPVHYDLTLEPNFDKFTFDGTVIIEYVFFFFFFFWLALLYMV